MEENSGVSEKRTGGSRFRSFIPWVLGALAVLLAFWGISVALDKMVARPPSVQDSAGADLPNPPVATTGTDAKAQVSVRVLDSTGKEFPVGAPLPRRLSLLIREASGQEYMVPFDRVGVWVVEAPDGTYAIPPDQKELGNWSWKIGGKGVAFNRPSGSWNFVIKKGPAPLVIEITLY